MTELEKIQRAKMYIDKLANGINPLDDKLVAEDDVINNVRISRCLFYVSSVLEKVLKNECVVSAEKVRKDEICISEDEIQNFNFSDIPIAISEITKRVNEVIKTENSKKLSHGMISDWLLKTEFLVETTDAEGKRRRRPTSNGFNLGISVEERQGQNGSYDAVLYNRNAQEFIIDNIFAIIDNYKDRRANQGTLWTEEDELQLVEMFKQNVSVAQMSSVLKRTRGAIRSKLKKLGFEEM